MNTYYITAKYYDDFYIYKNGILYWIAKRKYIWFSGVEISIYPFDKDELIFSYKQGGFPFYHLKINHQNLPFEIELLEDSSWKEYCLQVNGEKICYNFRILPQKNIGKVKINNKEVASIVIPNLSFFGGKMEFEIRFDTPESLEDYCIILF